RVSAALIHTFRDFDIAEEAIQDAFAIALERWPREGIPPNPAAWITTAAKRKAIDGWRRERVLAEKYAALGAGSNVADEEIDVDDEGSIRDDRLRLTFTCC